MTSPREAALYISRLQALAERLAHQAALSRNGDGSAHGEKVAGSLDDDRHAIDWAVRQLEPNPEIAAPQRLFDALNKSA